MSRVGLQEAKQGIAHNDPQLQEAYIRLLDQADRAFDVGPFSVMLKSKQPPSGNKHNYMSMAPYSWPDPAKENGVPYVGRDGYINPEWWQDYDRVPLQRLTQACETLALAYYFSEHELYAHRAAHLLRVWFLDPDTRMTPDLVYAQQIPGRNIGTTIVIDTRFMPRIVDAVGLLESSKAWTEEDQDALVDWFKEYTDKIYKRADARYKETDHNIATFYHAQIASQALFVGDTKRARKMILRIKSRIEKAITTDGVFAPEQTRSRSLSYSCFHLYAMFNLATMGEYVDVNLWDFSTADGRSLSKAIDFLAKHAGRYPPESWPYQEKVGTKGDWWDPFHDQLPVVLYHAAKVYGSEQYANDAAKILEPRDGLAINRLQLMLGIPLIGEQAIDGWLFQPSSESPVFER